MTTTTMKMAMRMMMIAEGCLLCFLVLTLPVTDGQQEKPCFTSSFLYKYPGSSHLLCYNGSFPQLETTANCKPGYGFVLNDLVFAPLDGNYYKTDCATYHNAHLFNSTCLRQQAAHSGTDKRDEFDRTVFNILNHVSGQNSISTSLPVEPFHFQMADGRDVKSSFLAFQHLCKPANPKLVEDGPMMSMCTNQTVRSHLVTLTLASPQDVKVPSEPSMCRCTIRPTGRDVTVTAFDIRLQARDEDRSCGNTKFKLESADTTTPIRNMECEGQEALYGLKPLYSTSQNNTVITITLSSVTAQSYPTALWLEVKETYKDDVTTMEVSCEEFLPMPKVTSSGKDMLGIIIGASVGGVLLIVGIILFFVFCVKKRRSGSLSLMSCASCHNGGHGKKGKKPYNSVPQTEPVYSEPGLPRPSNRDPYTFPVDSKFTEGTYAEPDPNAGTGKFFGTMNSQPPLPPPPPPPLPDSPPPSSPPPGITEFPVEPPPKPERTLLRKKDKERKDSGPEQNEAEADSSTPALLSSEDYDHIFSGQTWKKSDQGGGWKKSDSDGQTWKKSDRDGQNNIIDGESQGERNVYSHLKGDDYAHVGVVSPKPVVKDNIYDTTA